ncbi:MAG: MFS transporter [Candidatus Lokiarchaeota archaeon]|nr:MFS transporter [Candidatus Lokiarchaeota archaeon]
MDNDYKSIIILYEAVHLIFSGCSSTFYLGWYSSRVMRTLKKMGYSVGSITATLPQYMIQTYIFIHYLVRLHMNEFWLAGALTVWGVWNAVNDPIFGYLSDKTRTRWGKRVPWIAIFALPLALSTYLVFAPPGDAFVLGDISLFIWLTLTIIFYDTCYTIVVLNWTALFPEMFTSNEERSQVSVIRQIFSIFGLIAGTVVPAILASTMGWDTVAFAIGLVAALFAFLSLAGVEEREEFKQEKPLPIIDSMKYTFTNRAFLIFVSYNFFVQYVIAVVMGALPFYAEFVLFQDISLIFITAFVSAILFFAIWNKMIVTKGPRTTAIVTMLWVGVSLLGILVAADLVTALLVIALAGMGVGGFMILPDILIAFAIDHDETKTGIRREGAYFGFNAFVMRFAVVAQAWTYSLILYASGFDEQLPVQPDSAILALRVLLSILPLVASLIGIAIISKYPYHGEKLEKIQKEIALLHDEKKQNLERDN